LIHSLVKKIETAKETNWEQKFQKPQNENICLTNPNVENKGNFPILSFGDVGLWGICFKTVSLFDVVKLAKSAIICYVE